MEKQAVGNIIDFSNGKCRVSHRNWNDMFAAPQAVVQDVLKSSLAGKACVLGCSSTGVSPVVDHHAILGTSFGTGGEAVRDGLGVSGAGEGTLSAA